MNFKRRPFGIVISTHMSSLRTWLPDCLESIAVYSEFIHVHVNTPDANYFEAGGITAGWRKFDQFWHIPDTVVVKNPADLFKHAGSVSAGPRYISCVGLLRSSTIDTIGPPDLPVDKLAAAVLVEDLWFHKYMDYDPPKILDQGFDDKQVFVERHGRTNMVLESDLFRKYKGTWNVSMIPGYSPERIKELIG